MELKDTVKLMTSENKWDNLKAEYYQTKIRYEEVYKTLIRFDAGTLKEDLYCSPDVLREQCEFMRLYLHALEIRCESQHLEL